MPPLVDLLLTLFSLRLPSLIKSLSSLAYFAYNFPWLLRYSTLFALTLYSLLVSTLTYAICAFLASPRQQPVPHFLTAARHSAYHYSPVLLPGLTRLPQLAGDAALDGAELTEGGMSTWQQALLDEVQERNRQFELRKKLNPTMTMSASQLRPISLRRVNYPE